MPSNLSDTAKEIFQEEKGHCSQAIFAAYGEQLGLGKVDYGTCMKISIHLIKYTGWADL